MSEPQTLVELLGWRAAATPEARAYTFLASGETEGARLTYAELDLRARAIGTALAAAGGRGERVLLLLPPGLDFVAAFFGCLYAGAVAVPAYPPRSQRTLPRLLAVARDARPAVTLTVSALLPRLVAAAAGAPELAEAKLLALDTIDIGDGAALSWEDPGASPATLALLQYTSGSTGTPKGVRVTHGNLLANQAMIRAAFAQSERSVIVGWLPLYHDMGLIGNVLQPLYLGAPCILMSPLAFLERPLRWLEAIARYRATTSGGPNFAYELCLRRSGEAERSGLDLSSWEVAFDGAEPVRPETLDRFAAAFAPCGFRRTAFVPCYGLAEATLLVSAVARSSIGGPAVAWVESAALERDRVSPVPAASPGARALAGSGRVVAGLEVKIVDPHGHTPVPAGRIGEIWVAGPSVADGYWQRPEESARDFQARTADDRGPYLRTGDLGFFDGGELYVTGRIKDLIILRGRNLYPQDLERTAEQSHPLLRAGGAAAFSVDGAEGERLVVVHEVERGAPPEELPAATAALRAAIAEEHEAQVFAVVLISGGLPKTSSGKVERHACRASYLAGKLAAIGGGRLDLDDLAAEFPETPETPEAREGQDLLARLRTWAGRALRLAPEQVDPTQPLTALGLDSLAAVELAQTLEAELGSAIPFAHLLAGPSLVELAAELAARAEGLAAGSPRETGGPGAEREFPLSYGQRALWFLDRLAPGSSAYVVAAAARVRGAVDARALRRALTALAGRHPALRTTYHEGADGEPFQRVEEALAIDFCESEEPDSFRFADVSGIAAFAYQPFDLGRGPLLRAGLCGRPGERALVLALPHLATDFHSFALLVRDLGALYTAEVSGEPAALPPLAGSYAEHVRRQSEALAGPAGERLFAFWRQRLQGFPWVLGLPTDRPRPPLQTFHGAAHPLRLAPGVTAAVAAAARESGATPFMVLLAAFQVLLGRLSGQERLLVGAPNAGREGHFAEVAGYFVNPLVFTADLAAAERFHDLLTQVREGALAAFAHRDLPFPLLAEHLQPERDPARPPLVQAVFALQAAREGEALTAWTVGVPGARLTLGGLELESLPLPAAGSQFDLSAVLARVGEVYAGRLIYNPDLWDPASMARLAGHLETLLGALAEEPQACLGRRTAELPLLSAAQRHQLLAEWSGLPLDYPGSELLHGLFAAQAARLPEKTAVWSAGRWLTYGELDARSDRLAARLRGLGVGPESIVGVCLARSFDLVAGVLGILKAGGAYLPLDPGLPAERLGFLIADARARAVLVEAATVDLLPADGALRLRVDRAGPTALPCPPDLGMSPEHPAYVIYTSGSTGRPKGVVIPHRAIAARMRFAVAEDIPAGERMIQKTTLSFDISVFELFGPLFASGQILLPRPGGEADPAYLLTLAAEHEVGHLSFPPSLLTLLLEQESFPALRSIRTIVTGGETVPPDLPARFHARMQARLYNRYGPTETTISVTSWRCRPDDAIEPRVPIGRPIPVARVHLLDPHLQPVPPGISGELYIGGGGLARGYLGRPGRTAETFLPHPFGGPGERLYRTGDMARFRTDGAIEFLGRIDGQVKVRGFRVELGEIEAAILAHPGVREAVVIDRDDPATGSRRLVAWLVPRPDAVPAVQEVRQFLTAKLPGYMVPSAFVVLDAFPLTPSGKVDRRALPEPETAGSAGGAEAVGGEPQGPLEELLAGIWGDLLGVARVGRQDRFFDLGGHSLLATRLAARVRETLGVELPLRAVFEAPTLAAFAAAVEEARRAGGAEPAPPLRRAPRTAPLPLSFAQERLWFLDQLEPDGAAYNLPAALRLSGPLDRPALAAALGAIVGRHEALRTTFRTGEAGPTPVIGAPAAPPFLPDVELRALPAGARRAEARRLQDEDARRPFDLGRGPLLRTALLRLTSDEHALLLTLHHIVADGWSIGVLARELGEGYRAFAAGRPPALPELPLQYADYAVQQRQWLAGEGLAQEIAWWRERLAGAPAVVDLPTDRPRPAVQSYRGATLRRTFPSALGERLTALARRAGATLFMVLLAGFEALHARLAGADDLVVGTPVANRGRIETEELIGLFVNTLALRADLSGDPPVAELLRRVRERTLDDFAHGDLPFEKIVEAVRPERSLAYTPLFQALLVLQNAPFAPLALPGLAVELDLPDNGTAKFDLTLTLDEGPAGLRASLVYASDLFDRTTAERLLAGFGTLLAGIAAHAGDLEDTACRLSRLPLLSAAQAHQLGEWNDTEETFPETGLDVFSLHDLVRRRATRTPGAIAVVDPGAGPDAGRTLTYGELDAYAGALARRLAERGVGPEVRVAIAAERSLELIVGLLAILTAGGAYVPLDPAYPADHLAYLLLDSAPAVLLAQGHLLERLPVGSVPTLLLDGLLDGLSARDPRPGPSVRTDPANLAYVLYTSGSTGRPKGAMNTHRGIVNRLLWMQRYFHLTPDDAVLQKTPVSFDVSVWELFWPLLAGARLVFARPGGHLDGVYMAELIQRESVTTLHFVPPMLAAWLETPGVERCTSLRRVIASGESLPAELAERYYRHLAAPLYNLYGPTEAAVDVTVWACEPGAGTRPVPIGRPIANTSVHLLGRLDHHGEPVPIGVAGELLLGGVQLARGYHARPGLTAERFVPAPGGQRLYRTGDLARRRGDGAVEFLGRLDHQVKIRGVRIELGEIEAALLAHPAVGEAVVLAREDRPGERRLAAYVVPVPGVPGGLDPEILRAHLSGRLPEALLPAALVVLDVLPLSPNGKVDRRALPAPERLLAAGTDAEPATPVERILAALWAELLGLPQVGRDDNFFALGGDSILSLQVVARAHRAGLHLVPRDLFEHQTLARLAAAARPLPTSPASSAALADSSLPEGPVPLTPIQRWFFDQDLAEPHHFNQALLLALSPAIPPGRLAAALAGLPERHAALRLRFRREPGGWEQTLAPAAGRSPLSAIDLSALPEPRRRAALESACAAAQTGFDLARGPLFRALLFSLGTEARLLLAAHHLVVDGVSWRVLLEDLGLAIGPETAEIPETATAPVSSTTSFPAWATRLTAELRAGARREEIPLWLDAAGGAVPPLPAGLPASPNAGPDTWAGARTLRLALDPERTEALLHEVPARSRARVDELLLTALAQAFARWSGSPRLRLDLEGHGREPVLDGANGADLSRSVGWFTALFPVVFDLAGAHSPSGVLRAVRQRLRALPDGGIGYGLLRYLSGAEAAAPLAALPAAEVLFNYLGRLDPALPAASPFAPAPEAPGPTVGPGNRRSHRFQVGAGVAAGRLVLTFTYGAARDRQETVEALARDTLATLERLVDHARSPSAEETHVPADFPDVDLSQKQLASVLKRLGRGAPGAHGANGARGAPR